MNKAFFKRITLAAATVAALSAPGVVFAEQTSNTGAGTISTNARHDFTVIIPRFLQFRVGAVGGTISAVTCDLSLVAGLLGDGSDQACTGGDAAGGASNVSVRSNAGNIGITATTTGALTNAAADTLPFSEIITTTGLPALPAPTLPASGGTSASVAVTPTSGSITERATTWTYSYNNSAVYAAGTYGGVGVFNGRVTYTASSP